MDMNKIFLFIFLFLFNVFFVLSQESFTVSGFVEDSASGETLIGVNVFSNNLQVGTTTNSFGFFSITLPKGEIDLSFSFIGLKILQRKLI